MFKKSCFCIHDFGLCLKNRVFLYMTYNKKQPHHHGFVNQFLGKNVILFLVLGENMKKIFAVFGMIVFIYTTMSIFAGEMNPLLWISGSGESVFVMSMTFAFELFLFLEAIIRIYGFDE